MFATLSGLDGMFEDQPSSASARSPKAVGDGYVDLSRFQRCVDGAAFWGA